MIREICENSNRAIRNQFDLASAPIGMKCSCCNGQFLFAAMDFKAGPMQLTGPYFQHLLIRFCPFCGARNTEPDPKFK